MYRNRTLKMGEARSLVNWRVVFLILGGFWAATLSSYHRDISVVQERGAQTEAFKIGVILPLTGDFATASTSLRRGVEAAGRAYGYSVVIEDDGGLDPSRAALAVRKLLYVDRVDIVIISSFDVAPAVAPLLQHAKVPGVVLWDSNDELRSEYPYLFALGYSPEHAGDTLAYFMVNCLSARRVAIVAADTKWSQTMARHIRSNVGSSGVATVVSNESVSVDTTDFRSLIARIVVREADTVVVPLYSRGIVSFIRQARQSGYSGTILTGETLFESEVQSLGSFSEEIYMTNAWIDREALTHLRSEDHQSNIPDTARFALAFDAVSVARDYDQKRRMRYGELEAMHSVKIMGITGTITFIGGKISARTQPVVKIVAGRFAEATCSDTR